MYDDRILSSLLLDTKTEHRYKSTRETIQLYTYINK